MRSASIGEPILGEKAGASGTNGRSRERLIMVSNRGPVVHRTGEDGEVQRHCAAGGVATALASFATGVPVTWIASAASKEDCAVAASGRAVDLDDGKRLRLIAPPQDAYELFYGTFCNPILWFLQHSLWDRLQRANAEEEALSSWERGYLPVNQLFAEAVVEEIERDSGPGRVLLHDYHFYAAPLFIRNMRPSAVLQQFVHIPWPGPETWQKLPRPIVESFCEGLLANDSVVFQTERSAQNFVLTCAAFLSGVQANGETVTRAGHRTRVWHNPISVDIWELRTSLASPEAQAYRANLRAEAGERTIVRVDRLDPSKNVATGFRAFGRLLEEHPEWIGRAKFLAFLVPSRTSIPEYRSYEDEVFAEIDAVNERFATAGWTPITVFHENNRVQALVAMSLYDVLLVNPVIDGMNLVSKEGPVLNQRDGVVMLSESTGSFAELGEHVLAVQPDDVDGTARALRRALSMGAIERRLRAHQLRNVVLSHDLSCWARDLLEDLERQVPGREPAPQAAEPSGSTPADTLSIPA